MASLKTVDQIKADGGILVGQWREGWELFAYPASPSGWQKVQARRSGDREPGRVRSAILAWNGERLAKAQKRDGISDEMRQWIAKTMADQSSVSFTIHAKG